jgi:hypothetical protein
MAIYGLLYHLLNVRSKPLFAFSRMALITISLLLIVVVGR